MTKIEPRHKHPTIFQRFDALDTGGAFVIHNDHDPVPLYYQMIAERGKVFEWEYLEKGPEVFEVKITKLGKDETSKTIGELAAKDYRKAEVFRKFGLDFCCGGHRSLKAACDQKGVDVQQVETALATVEQQPVGRQLDFDSWQLDFLADYIVNNHHKYVRASLPLLDELSQKVAKVHGDTHPEVVEIAQHYAAVAMELTNHMMKEEMVLFPYIKQLAAAHRDGTSAPNPGFGTIANPIRMMEMEHESAGDQIGRIRELSSNFTLPEDACASFRLLYGKLEEFEGDLFQHIHLENNILFPKSVEMEKAFDRNR